MFERKRSFDWKNIAIIAVGVIVLSGGIFLGVKSRDSVEEKKDTPKEEQVKETFSLSEDCEIWLHVKNEDGSESSEDPIMLELIDKNLLNKTEKEITAYLTEKYPDRTIDSINKHKIILTETMKYNDPTKSNKYSIEPSDEFLGVYKYDDNGNRQLVEKTSIKISVLPKVVQDEIKNGIVMNTEEEAYSKLGEIGM